MKFYILVNGQEQEVIDSELEQLWSTFIQDRSNTSAILDFDNLVIQKFGADARMVGSLNLE
jgi:hypothetical protein